MAWRSGGGRERAPHKSPRARARPGQPGACHLQENNFLRLNSTSSSGDSLEGSMPFSFIKQGQGVHGQGGKESGRGGEEEGFMLCRQGACWASASQPGPN